VKAQNENSKSASEPKCVQIDWFCKRKWLSLEGPAKFIFWMLKMETTQKLKKVKKNSKQFLKNSKQLKKQKNIKKHQNHHKRSKTCRKQPKASKTT
jgi:hypothetical protein